MFLKMNDFTKEEVEDIELVYRAFCGDGRLLTDLEQSIMKKLKLMVDNYCEHDYRSMGNHPWLHCIKCKNNFNFTQSDVC